jgi:hypothetical protein
MKIQKPKSEGRMNSEFQKTKRNGEWRAGNSDFELRASFGFRASDFGFDL